MDALKLSELEVKYFSELFTSCDIENTGKVSGLSAGELFRASQLPPETLQQIIELCGAKRLGHFGRSQFYVALKLIASAQLGLPLKLEIFSTGLDIPLPKFARINEPLGPGDKRWSLQSQSTVTTQQTSLFQQHHSLDLHLGDERQDNCNQILGQLPPPPMKNQVRNTNNTQRATMTNDKQTTGQQHFGSTAASSPPPSLSSLSQDVGTANKFLLSSAVEPSSPVPLNTEKDWAAYVGSKQSTSLTDGTHWQQFEDEKQLLTTEDETSEQHSSDEDETDIWSITDEQREYYINQFRTLQSDLSGLISGVVAKEFFEKSKLPVQELSKIWQLSDVNKDGALSLEEFFTAMHLVVLRRNNVDLPDVLPFVLVPQIGGLASSAHVNSNGAVIKGVGSPQQSEPTSPHGKDWTHFNESPNSSVSSPGVKPVNFDFKKSAVEQDPKILHPVPVRLSPESQIVSSDEADCVKVRTVSDPIPYEPLQEQQKSPGKWAPGNAGLVESGHLGEPKLGPPPQAAIQRPVAKKTSLPGPGALPPPPQAGLVVSPTADDAAEGNFPFPNSSFSGSSSAVMSASYHLGMSVPQGPKKEPPPPPPPRPKRNHTRSSSLDLNRLVAGRTGPPPSSGPPSLLGAPPAVPPRMSPSTTTPKKLVGQKSESDAGTVSASIVDVNFADFHQFQGGMTGDDNGRGDTASKDVLQLKSGAFEVYRRPSDDGLNLQTNSKGLDSGAAGMKEDGTGGGGPCVDLNSNEEAASVKREPNWHPRTVDPSNPLSRPRDKKELQSAIRIHRDRNVVLSRLNSELNQELSEVMEERIALEIQLEHLKPYSN